MRDAFEETGRNFRVAGPEILAQATPHLWAYYRSFAEEFSLEERADYGIPTLPASADIWEEVTMTHPRAFPLAALPCHRDVRTSPSRARSPGNPSTASSW